MLHHIGLYVKDKQISLSFYQKMLKIKSIETIMWGEKEILFLHGEDFCIELMEEAGASRSNAHIAFSVPDTDGKIKELKRIGITPAEGPYKLANGWCTVFYEGPDGEEIEFIQTK